MDDSRSSVPAPLVAAVAALVLLAAYGAAYVLLGSVGTAGPTMLRVYNTSAEHWLFLPAARVESLIRGRDVQTAYKS